MTATQPENVEEEYFLAGWPDLTLEEQLAKVAEVSDRPDHCLTESGEPSPALQKYLAYIDMEFARAAARDAEKYGEGAYAGAREAYMQAMARYEAIAFGDEFDHERLVGANDNQPAQNPTGFARVSTEDLMQKAFAPVQWVIPGYVPEGLVLLAGKQKLGKTWLAIDWGAAVASGGRTMGVQCEQGDVLYIDMENGDRRIQRRINAMWPFVPSRPDLSRLEWTSASPEIGPKFFASLDQWRDSVRNPRLVVIDVLQRIKPVGKASRNAYENDYAALTSLQQWATENGIAVVALHHLRKGGSSEDDPFEKLSGSNGLSACADTTLVLDRTSQGCTLYGRGRDVEEIESAVVFDKATFRWNVQGNVTEVRRSTERGNILRVLADAGEPMSPSEIANVTGTPSGNVRRLLMSMVKDDEVRKSGRGRYVHPDVTDQSHTPGNNGNKVTKEHTPHNKVTNESSSLFDDDGQGSKM